MKILIVEDEDKLAEGLSRGLSSFGYETATISDGKAALDRILFSTESYDAILLDLMLPSLSGLEICKAVRTKSTVPIIILTARNESEVKDELFKVGASAYLVKPFSFSELRDTLEGFLKLKNSKSSDIKSPIKKSAKTTSTRKRMKR